MQFAEVTSVFGDAFLRGAGTVRFCERRNRTTMEGQTLIKGMGPVNEGLRHQLALAVANCIHLLVHPG